MRTFLRLSISSVAVAAPILMLITPAQAAMTDHALWHMDSDPMVDSSGNNNDGTLSGVTVIPDGDIDGAYRFDQPDSHVTVPDSLSLNPGTADFSYTVHVRFSSSPGTGNDYDLMRKGIAGTPGGEWKVEILQSTTDPRAGNPFCLFKDGESTVHTDSIRGSQNLADGVWHTITCVKTSTSDQLIVDGIAKTSTPATPLGSISNTAALSIGQKFGGGDQYAGDMDEVSIQIGTATVSNPPTVTTRSPVNGATGVANSTNVTATFSESVQAVDQTTFTLKDTASGAAVTAAVSYDALTDTATLDPNADLTAGRKYTASLTSGIHDLAGTALAPTSWTFTTAGAVAAPTVKSHNPASDATGVGLAANLTVTFSEQVQNVNGSTFTLTPAGGSPVAAAYTANTAGTIWKLDPSVNLIKDTRYTVTLTSGITDATGNALTPVTWQFLTGPAPTVSGKSPAPGATGVSRSSTVAVTFSEAVQNVSTATVTLTSASGSVAGAVTRSGTTNKWVFTPGSGLAAGTVYTVTVVGGSTGITDLAGNPLKTVTWTFTTV